MKLNLGSGTSSLPDYINIDRKNGTEAYPLSFPDSCADVIRASHLLEHFSHQQTLSVLREWARVLKPGGVLKISVPDFSVIVAVVNAGATQFPIEGWIMGGQQNADDFHRAIFTENKLQGLLELAGFENVTRWESDCNDCSAFDVSLNLQGVKSVCASETVERVCRGQDVSADGSGCGRDTCVAGVCS